VRRTEHLCRMWRAGRHSAAPIRQDTSL
jgi:hypothetical protein